MALRPANVLSLCSGVGGLELGIRLAIPSARSICFVEREIAAAASLVASMEAGWFHPCPVWSDLTTFDARPWRGRVHILASGDPCQDNSVAGKRAGSDGERFLAPEVVRIADECRPDLIVRENVPGNAGEQLGAIVPPLERLGYRVAAGIFSSAETGNTMRRERLIILACSVRTGRRQDAGRALGDEGADEGWPTPYHNQPSSAGSELGSAEDERHKRRGRTRGRRAGPTNAGRIMAHSPVQRSGEARSDFGRSEERDCRTGGELEQPKGVGPGESRTEYEGQQRRCAIAGTSDAMDRTDGIGRRPKGYGGRASENALQPSFRLPPAVIPGPTDSRWIGVLDRWPELQPALSQEEAESHLRRGIDAMAHRVERLRATGNGVDPVVAAYAILRLGALLAEGRTARDIVLMERAA